MELVNKYGLTWLCLRTSDFDSMVYEEDVDSNGKKFYNKNKVKDCGVLNPELDLLYQAQLMDTVLYRNGILSNYDINNPYHHEDPVFGIKDNEVYKIKNNIQAHMTWLRYKNAIVVMFSTITVKYNDKNFNIIFKIDRTNARSRLREEYNAYCFIPNALMLELAKAPQNLNWIKEAILAAQAAGGAKIPLDGKDTQDLLNLFYGQGMTGEELFNISFDVVGGITYTRLYSDTSYDFTSHPQSWTEGKIDAMQQGMSTVLLDSRRSLRNRKYYNEQEIQLELEKNRERAEIYHKERHPKENKILNILFPSCLPCRNNEKEFNDLACLVKNTLLPSDPMEGDYFCIGWDTHHDGNLTNSLFHYAVRGRETLSEIKGDRFPLVNAYNNYDHEQGILVADFLNKTPEEFQELLIDQHRDSFLELQRVFRSLK
jgi:hypothetical protein